MAKPDQKRHRRKTALALGEALGKTLDPVLKKRGFATRDILAHWKTIAPPPYGETTAPEKLTWPRAGTSGEGAVLNLRCAPGQALAVAHDGPRIAAAVNRYFGYLVVDAVRLSASPFTPGSAQKPHQQGPIDPGLATELQARLGPVGDPELRAALAVLGRGVLGRKFT